MGIFVMWIIALCPVCSSGPTGPTDEFIKGTYSVLIILFLTNIHHKRFKDTETVIKKSHALMAGNDCFLSQPFLTSNHV